MTISEIHRPLVLGKIDDRMRHVINNAPTNEQRLTVGLEYLLAMKPELYVYDAYGAGTKLTTGDFNDEDLATIAHNLTTLEGFYKRGIKVTLGFHEGLRRVFFVERSQPQHQ